MASKYTSPKGLKVKYDKFSDVLYISFGEPRQGLAVEIGDGDLVRIDPFTDEVLGITIIDFREKHMDVPAESIDRVARKAIPKILKDYRIQSKKKGNVPQ